jgi:hypothetical protein
VDLEQFINVVCSIDDVWLSGPLTNRAQMNVHGVLQQVVEELDVAYPQRHFE